LCIRDAELLVEGCDKFDNLFGTLLHPAGVVSVELVRNGELLDEQFLFSKLTMRAL